MNETWKAAMYRALFTAIPTGLSAGATSALAGLTDRGAILTGIVAFCTAMIIRGGGEGAYDNGSAIQRAADVRKATQP